MNVVCRLFGHSWWRPSTVGCLHRCRRCNTEEYWCYSFTTVKSGDKYELNTCNECGGHESIVGGELTNRERDRVGVF